MLKVSTISLEHPPRFFYNLQTHLGSPTKWPHENVPPYGPTAKPGPLLANNLSDHELPFQVWLMFRSRLRETLSASGSENCQDRTSSQPRRLKRVQLPSYLHNSKLGLASREGSNFTSLVA